MIAHRSRTPGAASSFRFRDTGARTSTVGTEESVLAAHPARPAVLGILEQVRATGSAPLERCKARALPPHTVLTGAARVAARAAMKQVSRWVDAVAAVDPTFAAGEAAPTSVIEIRGAGQ